MSATVSETATEDKLRELVLYLATLSEGDEGFGAVKLNKLLFYCDFLAYRLLGESITGQEYQKLEHGPAPRRLVPILAEMKNAGQIAVRRREYFSLTQNRPFALRPAELSLFRPDQLELVHGVVKHFWGKSAKQVSQESHYFIGWQLAEAGETIPYEAALIGERELTAEERRRGQELEELARECLARG